MLKYPLLHCITLIIQSKTHIDMYLFLNLDQFWIIISLTLIDQHFLLQIPTHYHYHDFSQWYNQNRLFCLLVCMFHWCIFHRFIYFCDQSFGMNIIKGDSVKKLLPHYFNLLLAAKSPNTQSSKNFCYPYAI